MSADQVAPAPQIKELKTRSGATLAAIAAKVNDLPAGSRILGFNYDTGERYLSVPEFLPE